MFVAIKPCVTKKNYIRSIFAMAANLLHFFRPGLEMFSEQTFWDEKFIFENFCIGAITGTGGLGTGVYYCTKKVNSSNFCQVNMGVLHSITAYIIGIQV